MKTCGFVDVVKRKDGTYQCEKCRKIMNEQWLAWVTRDGLLKKVKKS